MSLIGKQFTTGTNGAKVYAAGSLVNVRYEPSTDSDIVEQVPSNSFIGIFEGWSQQSDGRWIMLFDPDTHEEVGFVREDVVDFSPGSSATGSPAADNSKPGATASAGFDASKFILPAIAFGLSYAFTKKNKLLWASVSAGLAMI